MSKPICFTASCTKEVAPKKIGVGDGIYCEDCAQKQREKTRRWIESKPPDELKIYRREAQRKFHRKHGYYPASLPAQRARKKRLWHRRRAAGCCGICAEKTDLKKNGEPYAMCLTHRLQNRSYQ